MKNCYDGTLVMPNKYVVVNEEEMTYIEGGFVFHLTNSECKDLAAMIGTAVIGLGPEAVATAITAAGGLASLFPVGGPIISAVVGAVAWDFANAFIQAITEDKGVEIHVGLGVSFSTY